MNPANSLSGRESRFFRAGSINNLQQQYKRIKAKTDVLAACYLDIIQECRAQPMMRLPANAGPEAILRGITSESIRITSMSSRALVFSTNLRSNQMEASMAAALAQAEHEGIRQLPENGLTQ